ncbi:hypothetical protein OS493_015063 [Desmophyllum pertusum]|uniref:NACHT domain-containing protein n=1 Tax=Desmophyllum pertusum TaxID=174260 RepID=A0A9W9ZRB2_9CNID|nr:hypothetical protein OS493_015063 [Desmophyllum pertusum]
MEQLEKDVSKTGNKMEQLEQGFAKTDDKVEQLEQGFANTDNKMGQLEKDVSETGGKVKQLEQGFAKTDDKVEQLEKDVSETGGKVKQLEQGFAKTDDKVEQLEQGSAKTDGKVEQLEQGSAKTDDKVEQLEKDVSETGGKVKQLEQGFAKTDDKMEQLEKDVSETGNKMEQLEQGFAKTDDKVEQLEQGFANTDNKMGQLEKDVSETGGKVKQLEQEVRSQRMKENKPEASPVEPFDVKICRSKLAEHYKRTAKVPTSVWSKASPVDIHQIYTRLSWVKEEQTPAGSSQSELTHYTDVFTPNKNGDVPNRILVQGQTGIGKSTFVKKLAVDWAELDDEKTEVKQGDALERFENDADTSENNEETSQDYKDTASDEYDTASEDENTSCDEYEENQKNALKKFELVLVINLKEVSKCQSLRDVISHCNIFPEEEKALTEGLLSYIAKNQEKVLLVFDGYDEYRCGSNSEIYEIFRGKKLRNCCVLITTRISQADELREFKDVHANITGFSEEDGKVFMKRMLGGKTEAKELRRHLSAKNLEDLARVPLLLLFFCTLWKQGKLKYFPETKTKLYLEIVQHVLYHSQGKQSPARFGKVQDFKVILAEIGKVALECLLKDDHVFEYDQLSAAILCEESLIIGLLQVTEYAENLRPAGMVSFIHKSIQEFLAAWYITYRCVPEGNLGGIEEHARTLEDCETLENVFQFICGLSDDGAVKVFEHLTSVGISDPTLDLSKIIPDLENETDVPLCDVTAKHRRFSKLVYNSFQEVHSKAELLSHCFDCTGGIVLVTKQLTELLQKAKLKDLTQVTHSVIFLYSNSLTSHMSTPYELVEFLDCLHVPLRITKNSKFSQLETL